MTKIGQASQQIVHLRITLDGVEPKVMRRVAVPFGIWLDSLHLVIQAAMGWTNSHMYVIQARGCSWGTSDPDFPDDVLSAEKATLADLVADTAARSFKYVYDFGDDWRHSVKIEQLTVAAPGVAYPLLLDASGRCPPEDCGGSWGYMDMLAAIRDPAHERHSEYIGSLGSDFDPGIVDMSRLAENVARLAKLMSPRRVRRNRRGSR
jgi:hypothetical protein